MEKYWDLHCIHTLHRRITHRIRYKKILGMDPFFNIVESQIIAEIKIYILLHIIVNHRSLLYSKVNHISKGFKMADEKTRSVPISYSCDVQKPYESFEILFRMQTVFFTQEVKIISCKSLNQLKIRFGRVRI